MLAADVERVPKRAEALAVAVLHVSLNSLRSGNSKASTKPRTGRAFRQVLKRRGEVCVDTRPRDWAGPGRGEQFSTTTIRMHGGPYIAPVPLGSQTASSSVHVIRQSHS